MKEANGMITKKAFLFTVALLTVLAASVYAQNSGIPDNMVLIQGGTFIMGSPPGEKDREDNEIQHKVTVSSFYIGKYEVTQKEYQEVTGTNPSHFTGDPNLPVENVNWYDAVEYCNKRSRKEGLTPAYTIIKNPDTAYGNTNWTVTLNKNANGYRLPTEAEWEYACRAGTTTAFNTGNNMSDNACWYRVNSDEKTHPVGQKSPNAWGLYDMHGNVCEWCWDWLGDYPSGAQTDPLGALTGYVRAVRGSGWYNTPKYLRSAYRGEGVPVDRGGDTGLRVVRSAK